MKMPSRVFPRLARTALGLGLGAALLIPSAPAFQFSEGDLTGSLDSTFSFGGLYRLNNPDPQF